LVIRRILNAVELGFIAAASLFVVPMVEDALPDVPGIVVEIVTPVVIAVAVVVVSILFWQRPVITATWSEETGPDLENIRVQLHPATLVSPLYEVGFTGVPRGLMTQWLMWTLRRRGLRLTFEVPGALVSTTMRHSTRDESGAPVGLSDYRNGFSMKVNEPAASHTWLLAKVFFQAETRMNQRSFSAKHKAVARGFLPGLLARLVKVDSPTKMLTFY